MGGLGKWSCWFTSVSITPLLKVVARRVTYFLDEIPDFQSKIRGVGFPLPFSPTGRGRGQPLVSIRLRRLVRRPVPRRVPRRGRGVKAFLPRIFLPKIRDFNKVACHPSDDNLSFFPGRSRLREQGKNGVLAEIRQGFSRKRKHNKNRRALPLARPLAGSPRKRNGGEGL